MRVNMVEGQQSAATHFRQATSEVARTTSKAVAASTLRRVADRAGGNRSYPRLRTCVLSWAGWPSNHLALYERRVAPRYGEHCRNCWWSSHRRQDLRPARVVRPVAVLSRWRCQVPDVWRAQVGAVRWAGWRLVCMLGVQWIGVARRRTRRR